MQCFQLLQRLETKSLVDDECGLHCLHISRVVHHYSLTISNRSSSESLTQSRTAAKENNLCRVNCVYLTLSLVRLASR